MNAVVSRTVRLGRIPCRTLCVLTKNVLLFLQAKALEKLPAVYLIDSVVKNIPQSNYLQLFSQIIVSLFSGVFEKVSIMRHSLNKSGMCACWEFILVNA